MEIVGNSVIIFIIVFILNVIDFIWYFIVVKNDIDGWKIKRFIVLNYLGGLLNCFLINDMELIFINNDLGEFFGVCGGGIDIVIFVNIINIGIDF